MKINNGVLNELIEAWDDYNKHLYNINFYGGPFEYSEKQKGDIAREFCLKFDKIMSDDIDTFKKKNNIDKFSGVINTCI